MSIPIAKPWFDDREWAAVRQPLESGWVVQGPKTRAFEEGIARYTGAAHAVATTSCTTALHLGLLALGVKPGDEVVVPAFTFVASGNSVEYCGARPVFADIALESFNLDPVSLAAAVGRRTKALMPVHLFGLAAEMGPILDLARRKKLRVIEDAACAIGTRVGGRHAGTLGDCGCLSFHPRKSITTGEGGMLLTADAGIAKEVGHLRDHGGELSDLARHQGGGLLLPEYDRLGYNYRMTDIQSAIGLAQLEKLPEIVKRKRVLAARYDKELAALGWLDLPIVPPGHEHGYQAYVTLYRPDRKAKLTHARVEAWHEERNAIMRSLLQAGVATRQGTHAVHALGYYRRKYGLKPWDFPNAWIADRLSLALPLYPQMTGEEQDSVIAALRGSRPCAA